MKATAMKVLVTGATGFLGRWVTRALLEAEHEVVALSRRFDAEAESPRHAITRVPGDVTGPGDVERAMAGVDAVIHCAGSVSLKGRDRKLVEQTNVVGTSNVLAAAAARSLKVLHTSSTATIGPSRDPLSLDEAAPPATLSFDSIYVQSKRRAEAIALSYARDGLDVVVLNPGVLLGPDDANATSTQLVVGYLTGRLRLHLRGGASFCDVRDVAAAYVSALVRGSKGQRYILAGHNMSHAELQAELQRLTGLPPSLPLPQAAAEWLALWSQTGARFFPHPLEELNLALVGWGSLFNYCSATKAQRELGYRLRPLTETLIDTIAAHLRAGLRAPSTRQLRQLLADARPTPQ